jgi:hypothetical protein
MFVSYKCMRAGSLPYILGSCWKVTLKFFLFTDAKKWKDKFEEAKVIVETQCELYAKECK